MFLQRYRQVLVVQYGMESSTCNLLPESSRPDLSVIPDSVTTKKMKTNSACGTRHKTKIAISKINRGSACCILTFSWECSPCVKVTLVPLHPAQSFLFSLSYGGKALFGRLSVFLRYCTYLAIVGIILNHGVCHL